MAAPGANIAANNHARLGQEFIQFIGLKQNGLRHASPPDADGTAWPRQIALLSKTSDTAPQNNTAADAPTGLGDLVLHYTAAGVLTHIYRCSAYTDVNTFTYTQVF